MKKETVLSVVKEIRDYLKGRFPVCGGVSHVGSDKRFIRNADGTITDKQLNLTWHPTLPEKLTWGEAKKACEKIGCRLPTRRELESLVDITKHDPAIDKEIFPDMKNDWYWTGDSCAWDSGYAWCVGFYGGTVDGDGKDSSYYVRLAEDLVI